MSRMTRSPDCKGYETGCHIRPDVYGSIEATLYATVTALVAMGGLAKVDTIDGQRRSTGLAHKVEHRMTRNGRPCIVTTSVEASPGHDGRWWIVQAVSTATYEDGTMVHLSPKRTVRKPCGCGAQMRGIVGRMIPGTTTAHDLAVAVRHQIAAARDYDGKETPVRDTLGHRADVLHWVHRVSVPDWQDEPNGGRIVRRDLYGTVGKRAPSVSGDIKNATKNYGA
jgi:hypothetical protein